MLSPSKAVLTSPPQVQAVTIAGRPQVQATASCPPQGQAAVGSSRDSTSNDAATFGTDLERQWHIETKDLQQFLATIKCALKRRKEGEAVSRSNTIESQAALVLASVENDLIAVKKAADAAELDIRTRLRGHKPHKVTSMDVESKEGSDNSDVGPLLCAEVLPETTPVDHHPSQDPEEFRKMIIMAAHDAALFRETARIIRRKARELCERRIRSNASSR
jgi:hypothetical protein